MNVSLLDMALHVMIVDTHVAKNRYAINIILIRLSVN